MATLTKEELIEEIYEIVAFLEEEDSQLGADYITEIMNNKQLEDCSVALLYHKRKLAQIYLSDYCLFKKDTIDKEIQKIDDECKQNERNIDLMEMVESLNNYKTPESIKTDYSYELRNLKSGLAFLNQLLARGVINGEVCFKCNLTVKVDLVLDRLNEKVRLIRKLQTYDRMLQRHMRKKSPCTVPDSNHEIRIKRIKEEMLRISKSEEEKAT
jgi:hypothetical protein